MEGSAAIMDEAFALAAKVFGELLRNLVADASAKIGRAEARP